MLVHVIPVSEQGEDAYQLLANPASVFSKLVAKLELAVREEPKGVQYVHQLTIHLLLLLRGMLSQQYPPALALIFAIIWTYGFAL